MAWEAAKVPSELEDMRRFMAEQVLLSRLGRHVLLEPALSWKTIEEAAKDVSLTGGRTLVEAERVSSLPPPRLSACLKQQ